MASISRLEAVDLGGDDAQPRACLPSASASKPGVQRSAPRSKRSFWIRASAASVGAGGMQPGEAERGVELVDGAVGCRPARASFGTRLPSPSAVSPASPVRV